MARISGVDIPRDKHVEISLTYIYGIGRPTAQKILADAGVEPAKRTGVGVGLGLGGGFGRGGWGFGPSISVNMGQSSNTKNTELARLLGEQEAVVQAARFKNCPIILQKKAVS